ncbi:LacI family DNA-binding transcriptional regulator [Rhodovulum adriaticum]|uniref:LacI family transcriptional regulator n=1 Tax=Rhodovulum adriaticum TaxID=35804 RepID=A0A4R2NMG4_RHOAD|nr:LacI family DNA-binding transcriptional regulator [Rhodovulum adriaticum]MBK1636924.1 hypothetical protein [Rhodovulum adriaticum]TCP22800.1 LacI family transcriptional regulator [Rhodovulum adriaticum]
MNLKELSRLLGLSQTTVSRALNGYPEVAEATRKRVEQAAQDHGYRPNARARGLATGRAMAVAQVIPADWLGMLANPILAEAVAGATEAFAAAGYETTLAPVTDAAAATAYGDMAARGAVDGALVHMPAVLDPHIAALEETRLPFVVHGQPLTVDAAYPWVGLNGVEAARQATRLLLRGGHSRIGLINGPTGLALSAQRAQGYRSVVKRRGLDMAPDLIRHCALSEMAGHDAAAALLDSATPPTALLTATLPQALGAARAVAERSGQVALATHDDVFDMMGGTEAPPRFAGTRAPIRETARRAAEMLLERIAAPDTPAQGERAAMQVVTDPVVPAPGV